ncbi:MAG: PAS domain S-box protein [Gemmatimonadaceae bacterium]|jgi:two-component system cell cycle sensor histidine kinase/response regulator CckA
MSGREPLHGRRQISEESLEAIVDTLSDMIWVKDAGELRFVLVNKGAEVLLGVSRDKLVGKSDYDLFSREQADAFVTRDREFLAGRQSVEVQEEEINTPNGVRVLRVRRYVIAEAGEPRYLLGISQDITDLKSPPAETIQNHSEAAQKLQAIGLLAGSFAHEFNDLLTVILTAAQTLLESSTDASEREDAGYIIASARRAASLTRELLALIRR